jgi:hypothetical protein
LMETIRAFPMKKFGKGLPMEMIRVWTSHRVEWVGISMLVRSFTKRIWR